MATPPSTQPVFLARRSYRRRRLRDAARVLPVAGAILWVLPLMSSDPMTGAVGLYIVAVWLALIVISAAIATRLHDGPDTDTATKDTSAEV